MRSRTVYSWRPIGDNAVTADRSSVDAEVSGAERPEIAAAPNAVADAQMNSRRV
jgi:hypothetical protein